MDQIEDNDCHTLLAIRCRIPLQHNARKEETTKIRNLLSPPLDIETSGVYIRRVGINEPIIYTACSDFAFYQLQDPANQHVTPSNCCDLQIATRINICANMNKLHRD